MAFRAGTVSKFYLNNIAASPVDLSPYIDNVDYPQTVEMIDVSVFGTAAKAFLNGLTDGDTISFSGPYDATVHSQLTALKAHCTSPST